MKTVLLYFLRQNLVVDWLAGRAPGLKNILASFLKIGFWFLSFLNYFSFF